MLKERKEGSFMNKNILQLRTSKKSEFQTILLDYDTQEILNLTLFSERCPSGMRF